MPKVYFVDNGIRNYSLRNLKPMPRGDIGELAEGFCFSEFLKKDFEVKFWRTQAGTEVDFLIQSKNLVPVEVKYKKFKKPLLEKSFINFLDKYQPTNSIIITKNYLDQHNYKNLKVYFIPIYLINAVDMLISS